MRTNEPPKAAGDTLTADDGRAVTIDVLEDDVDSDGDTVSVTSANPAAEHGTVSCGATGDCTYTPERGYSGRDSFRYSISDGYGGSSSAVVDVLVQAECTPLTHTLANGDTATTDGALSVKVDGLGGFGASVVSPGGEARFNPPGPTEAAGTVFSSNLYLSSANKLLTDVCTDGQTEEISRSAMSLVTRKTLGPIQIDLMQELGPIAANSSELKQTYTLKNTGSSALPLALVRHLDGDLLFDGTFQDGGAASASGDLLFEYDQSANTQDPSTFVGIAGSLGANDTPDRWTLQPFDYRDDIVAANGIQEAHDGVVVNDTDGDRIVNTPYDVTVSQQWDVPSLGPGASVTFVTRTLFGQQPPANEPPNAVDDSIETDEDTAGNDRLIGGAGNDALDGGNGKDWLDGGPGADAVRGGPGVDLMVSGNGDRGRDRVQGGPGRDRCRTDAVRACP